MILAAVPSGAAQEARYPAGTLGDIQAVTGSLGRRSVSNHNGTVQAAAVPVAVLPGTSESH